MPATPPRKPLTAKYLRSEFKTLARQERKNFAPVTWKSRLTGTTDIARFVHHLRMTEYYMWFGRKNPLRLYHLWQYRKLSRLLGFEIAPGTCDFGLHIPHRGNIVLNSNVRIGRNCYLYPGVVIGRTKSDGIPRLGNQVFVGPGVKIFGDVEIGDNVTLASNCSITKSVPANSVVVPSRMRYLRKEGVRTDEFL